MSTIKKIFDSLSYSITEKELMDYKNNGYVVISNKIPKLILVEIKQNINQIMDVIGLGQTKLRQTQQYLRGSVLDAYINSTFLNNIAAGLMEGESTMYLPFTAVKSGGGGGKFHFHQDNQYTTFEGPGINLWSPLVSTSKENGALQIVPKSHFLGDIAAENAGEGDHHLRLNYEPKDFITLEMEPGDIVAFNRLTIHGSGPNHTAENRVAYAVQFHRNDVYAHYGGKMVKLKDEPRWTDIHGVSALKNENTGSRDGH